MLGNIQEWKENKKYGFIYGRDKNTYYFHSSELQNITKFQLEEGDEVEFDIRPKSGGSKYDQAIRIRKTSSSVQNSTALKVYPGINTFVELEHFNDEEKNIIKKLSKFFYVTNGGRRVNVAGSSYKYCLIKTTMDYTALFRFEREILVVFCDYIHFEPRSLDVAPRVMKDMTSQVRVERGCYILISNDSGIEKRITELTKDTNQNSIIIPFSYYEIINEKLSEQKIQERFKKYLFDVDLYSETQPIRDDVFFFGRRDFVQDIAVKCKANTYSGVFGLRRSGKTSLLYAVKRMLESERYAVIYIPCNSELSKLAWYDALFKIVDDIRDTLHRSDKIHANEYNDYNATILFEDDLNSCLSSQSNPVVLMFDEIEYITFNSTTANGAWKEGKGFIDFWNAIRGYCLKYPKRLSIVVAGTNPMINEVPGIMIGENKEPNPMYGQFSQTNQGAYLPPFDIVGTTTMVNTLGGYMGIVFSPEVCAKLTLDCGGHPYLIRLLCKRINQYVKEQDITRPIRITQSIYDKVCPIFEKSSDAQGFYVMILLILQESFPTEYGVLKVLATKGEAQLVDTQDQNSLLHLLGYGLLDYNNGHYAIKFETIKRYMEGKYKFEVEGLDTEEQKKEIQLRTNKCEEDLRDIIKQHLRSRFGVDIAKSKIIDSMKRNRAVTESMIDHASVLNYKDLFDPSENTGLFLSVLSGIIVDNYDDFSVLFGKDNKETIRKYLKVLNSARRVPSHAFENDSRNWNEANFREFREAMKWMEEKIEEIIG